MKDTVIDQVLNFVKPQKKVRITMLTKLTKAWMSERKLENKVQEVLNTLDTKFQNTGLLQEIEILGFHFSLSFQQYSTSLVANTTWKHSSKTAVMTFYIDNMPSSAKDCIDIITHEFIHLLEFFMRTKLRTIYLADDHDILLNKWMKIWY